MSAREFLKDNEDYLVTVAERLLEIRHESQNVNENSPKEKQADNSSPKENPVHKTIVINAFGGPGAGKTTACLDITSMLKKTWICSGICSGICQRIGMG